MDYNVVDDYEEALLPDTDEIVTQADKEKKYFKIVHDVFSFHNLPPSLQYTLPSALNRYGAVVVTNKGEVKPHGQE